MTTDLSTPHTLAYESPDDSHAELAHLGWWIYLGGAAFGIAGTSARLLDLIQYLPPRSRVIEDWPPLETWWMIHLAIVCIASAAIGVTCIVAMRRSAAVAAEPASTHRRILIAAAITIGVSLMLVQAAATITSPSVTAIQVIRVVATMPLSFLWPLLIVWTARAEMRIARRRIWLAICAFGMLPLIVLLVGSVMSMSRASGAQSFAIAADRWPEWLLVAILSGITVIALIAALRGENRAMRVAIVTLMLSIILISAYWVIRFVGFGAPSMSFGAVAAWIAGSLLESSTRWLPPIFAVIGMDRVEAGHRESPITGANPR